MREKPMWRRYLSFLGSDPSSDVEDELGFHFAMRVEDLVRRGLDEDEARRQATREFGDVGRVRSELEAIGRKRLRRESRARGRESLAQDLRFAARTLRKSPGFTAVVAATLALGIGGTTSVFSVVEGVLLAPLPYEEPGQLVRFYQHNSGEVDPFREYMTGLHFQTLRDEAASFEGVAALYTYRETGLDLSEDGRAERLRVLEVSRGYFRTLRAGSVRGREFEVEDEVALPRVILSHELWRDRFDADGSLIGTTVRLGAEPYTVVGIAPARFEDPLVGRVDAWLPLDLAGSSANNEYNHFLSSVGRLRNGVELEQARAEIAGLNRAMAERWPDAAEDSVIMVPLQEDLVESSRGTLHLLLLAVGLVLLVACVNVANLFLVRSTGRLREFAIRSALGSGSARIARQLLVESLLLAALGGLLGLALAVLGVDALRALGRDAIPRLDEVGFDPLVLGFAALVTVATGVAFGVAPAAHSARIEPSRALREHSRAATGGRGPGRMRSGLAAAQVALAMTLLSGAGVLMTSFHRLQQVDLGFRTERVLTFDVNLPGALYDAERRALFQEELARRLETIAGVRAAGGISRLPATGSYHNWGTQLQSGPRAGTEESSIRAEQRVISGSYLAALDLPLLAGRIFDDSDDVNAPLRVVVSEAFAREGFPGVPLEQVVGQQIAPIGQEREVIGVVGDAAIDARGLRLPTVYHAHAQFADNRNWGLTLAVASELPPDQILPAARETVAALDPDLVVFRTASLDEVVGQGVGRERFTLALMATFAAVALLLAALGLYGVLAYAVRQRTQEIGTRIALGATDFRIHRLVLAQAATVVAVGLVAGIAGSLALGRWLSSLVFETRPWDPGVFTATALLLSVVALVAAWLPARRAARVEPSIAMRSE